METVVLIYLGRLYVPIVDGLHETVMEKDHSSRYSNHLCPLQMYCNLREVYWWNGMTKGIAEFFSKRPNCQQVKVEYPSPEVLSQNIELSKWMLEMIYMDFIIDLRRSCKQHDCIWVIEDWMKKSANFLPVKTTHSQMIMQSYTLNRW